MAGVGPARLHGFSKGVAMMFCAAAALAQHVDALISVGGDVEVRHKETDCTRAQRNGGKQTEERIERTEANRSGRKPTGIQTPLSGPRYRGSNPTLSATLKLL